MKTSTIRLPIRKLPDHFDRNRITTVHDEIESALMDDGGVCVRAQGPDGKQGNACLCGSQARDQRAHARHRKGLCAARDPLQLGQHVRDRDADDAPKAPPATMETSALIGRPSTVWEQVAVILFVASKEASYMTGALVASDGGWTAY